VETGAHSCIQQLLHYHHLFFPHFYLIPIKQMI
jgi:hypothetical protein